MNELMLSCVHLISLEGYVQAALVPRHVLCAILGLLWIQLAHCKLSGP